MIKKMENRDAVLAMASWAGTGWVFISEHATQQNVSFCITCLVNVAIFIYYIKKITTKEKSN